MHFRSLISVSIKKRIVPAILLAGLLLSLVSVPTSGTSIEASSLYCEGDFVSISLSMNDLGADEYFRLINGATGFVGGLYPDGSNHRPVEHDAAGIALASDVTPLDSDGFEDPENGHIVMVSIGMSNTSAEFNEFIQLAEGDDTVNPQLTIINGAQVARAADSWMDPNADAWQEMDRRLQSDGLSPLQLQVVWLKQAQPIESNPGEDNFPGHAHNLEIQLEAIIKNILTRYPNIKLVFLSSRSRAYSYWMGLHPEPYAFETGFSVKWLIERQISGDSELNFDPTKGEKVAPYLAWGPYLWADGSNPRSDGFTWLKSDLEEDCIHPSDNGRLKIANLLMSYFEEDPITAPWFLADYDPPPPPPPPPSYFPVFFYLPLVSMPQ